MWLMCGQVKAKTCFTGFICATEEKTARNSVPFLRTTKDHVMLKTYALEIQGLLLPGAMVVADNVLKPGSLLFFVAI